MLALPGLRSKPSLLPLLGHLLPTRDREEQHSLEVIDQILEPDLCSSPDHPNRSNELAAHRRHLVAEDMFDANSRPRSTPIPLFLLRRQGLVPIPFFLNVRTEVVPFEQGFGLLGAIG